MTFYALVNHDAEGIGFYGVFETIHHVNKAIADYYVEQARSVGEIDNNYKYKQCLFYAFEDEDEDLVDYLLSKYHDFIFNGLEDETYSTDFEIIPVELNVFLIDE